MSLPQYIIYYYLSSYRGGLPDFGTSQDAVQWCIGCSSLGNSFGCFVGAEKWSRRAVQGFGGCCGSLAELFRSRGSPPWPVRCSVVSIRGDAELVVQTSTASGEDPETIWRRSECDLRDSVNPRDSLTGSWKVLEKSWKVLLVALRDKFSSCESRHFGISRSLLPPVRSIGRWTFDSGTLYLGN
jgi:hypothetical protein